MHHAMTRVLLKRGLKQFKEKGEKAVTKELLQLYLNTTFRPITAGDLRDKDKDAALELLIFLKGKLDGSIKVRVCADGRNQ